MKAAPFAYHAPRALAEAIDLLVRLDNARPLAGGQSLAPMLNLRVATPDHLVDLGRVAGLAGIEARGDTIAIGAMTTQRAIERSDLIRARSPLLAFAIDHVGHQQTRNRGTIGGSLCHLDPGAELPVAALALDATLTIAGPNGERRLAFADFPAGYLAVALEQGEILTRIDVPVARPREGAVFVEFSRRPADFAIVSVAARLTLDDAGRVAMARLAAGGLGATPLRLADAERALVGESPTKEAIARAVATTAAIASDGDDLNPADYRRDLLGGLLGRALRRALARAEGGDHV